MRLRITIALTWMWGWQLLWAGSTLRLKTRDLEPGTRASVSARHLILQFNAPPDSGVLAELGRRRIRVLAYVPDSGLMVIHDGEVDLRGLNLRWAGAMEPKDKISPALATDASGVYLVMFHSDTNAGVARLGASACKYWRIPA